MKTDTMLDAIGMIDENLIDDAKKQRIIKKHKFIKPIVAVATIAVCITAPLSATAFGSDKAYSLLYHLSPSTAQALKPVQKSCIDNGIKMEVISADIDGSKASIYISLQDMEQNRIDKTVDLFDSYSINCPYDNISHCSFSEYDEETNTAYFLVAIERMDGKAIKNNKITFSVKEMIFGKETFSEILSDIDMNDISKNPDTMNNINCRGMSYKYEEPDYTAFEYLVPEDTLSVSPVEGVKITGIGYIDDELHIQTHYDDISRTDNHGFLSLIDKNGNAVELDEDLSISFWDENYKGSYDERIIKLPYEEISDYQLYGEFITSKGYTDGNWQITFSLNDINIK